jgi:hypothetical protein
MSEIRPVAVIFKSIKGTGLAAETYGSAYNETDNELLGVKKLTEQDLTKIVAEKLARVGKPGSRNDRTL